MLIPLSWAMLIPGSEQWPFAADVMLANFFLISLSFQSQTVHAINLKEHNILSCRKRVGRPNHVYMMYTQCHEVVRVLVIV